MTISNISSKDLSQALISDSINYLNECSDTFGQLESIFNAIIKTVDKNSEVGKLAGAGLYVAKDFENLADCWREEIQNTNTRGAENA